MNGVRLGFATMLGLLEVEPRANPQSDQIVDKEASSSVESEVENSKPMVHLRIDQEFNRDEQASLRDKLTWLAYAFGVDPADAAVAVVWLNQETITCELKVRIEGGGPSFNDPDDPDGRWFGWPPCTNNHAEIERNVAYAFRLYMSEQRLKGEFDKALLERTPKPKPPPEMSLIGRTGWGAIGTGNVGLATALVGLGLVLTPPKTDPLNPANDVDYRKPGVPLLAAGSAVLVTSIVVLILDVTSRKAMQRTLSKHTGVGRF